MATYPEFKNLKYRVALVHYLLKIYVVENEFFFPLYHYSIKEGIEEGIKIASNTFVLEDLEIIRFNIISDLNSYITFEEKVKMEGVLDVLDFVIGPFRIAMGSKPVTSSDEEVFKAVYERLSRG